MTKRVKPLFEEHIYTPAKDDFSASRVDIFTDAEGYFINIETCPYEGHAMITLPCAVKAHRALGKAIRAAKAARAARP